MSSKGSWIKEQQISELFFNGRHYEKLYSYYAICCWYSSRNEVI